MNPLLAMDTTSKTNYLKLILKGLAVTGSSFIIGFFAYYLFNRKALTDPSSSLKQENIKNIPIDKLEQIVEKIKNQVIYNIAQLYNFSHKFDPEEFIPTTTTKDEDVQVESIAVEKEIPMNQSSELQKEASMLSSALNMSIQRDNSKKSQEDAYVEKVRREMAQLYGTNPMATSDKLMSIELQIIRSFGFSPKEYHEAVKKHYNHSIKIQKNIELIKKFKDALDQDQLYPIHFPENLTNNYLKIISNIYYINMRKVYKQFKLEYVDKNHHFPDNKLAQKAINDLYKSFLKETRNEVIRHFRLIDSEELPVKYLLRIYPYYFSPYHPIRKTYKELDADVTGIIEKILRFEVIEELGSDSHPNAITSPVDTIIDFKHLLDFYIPSLQRSNTEAPKSRFSPLTEQDQGIHIRSLTNHLDFKEKILKKFNENYKEN